MCILFIRQLTQVWCCNWIQGSSFLMQGGGGNMSPFPAMPPPRVHLVQHTHTHTTKANRQGTHNTGAATWKGVQPQFSNASLIHITKWNRNYFFIPIGNVLFLISKILISKLTFSVSDARSHQLHMTMVSFWIIKPGRNTKAIETPVLKLTQRMTEKKERAIPALTQFLMAVTAMVMSDLRLWSAV